MQVFRGFKNAHNALPRACAVTIGNFDGVHRGHQAMIALLKSEAAHRGLPSCVMTFEPHPRDYFAALGASAGQTAPTLSAVESAPSAQAAAGSLRPAPARVATLRDKLTELARCGIDQVVVLPFNAALASMSADDFVSRVLVQGLGAKYVLVGDDFRFGAKRLGDYAMLDKAGETAGFDVARMQSYEVHGLRVSSSAVRLALHQGQMNAAAKLLGRPYSISGHVVHGRKLGRELGKTDATPMGFRTLNLRFSSRAHRWLPAASGIFAVLVHGLGELSDPPVQGVANLGIRPSLDPTDVNGGRVLLETHCLDWSARWDAEHGYGKIIRVELLHKLHDELKYDGLDALTTGIARDCADARAFFTAQPQDTYITRI